MASGIKIKSLSLSRGTQTPRKEDPQKPVIVDDENVNVSCLEAALNSPIARPSRQSSTPIRKSVDCIEESPDQDYLGSPMSLYPCTQENEVKWNWPCTDGRRPEDSTSEATGRSSSALNNTPKRHLLQKKRLAKANSPLLNIPPKRKLVNLEVAERIGKFAAELEALADEIKTGQSCGDEQKRHDQAASGSKQPNIFDMPTQKIFDIHEASTLEFSYDVEVKKEPEKTDSSLDDMFDDLDEACMVQCSQEVEDKLKHSANSSDSNANLCRDGGSSSSTRTVGSECRNGEGSKRSKSPEISASQIPDDSFDDCMAFCTEDDELMNNYLADAKKPEDSFEKLLNRASNSATMDKSNSRQVSSALDSNSNLKGKQQCISSGGASGTAQNRKFFKEKSLSDSFYNKSGIGRAETSNFGRAPATIAKSTSSYNLSSKMNSKNSVSAAGSRNDSASNNTNVNWSYRRNSGGSNANATSASRDRYSRIGETDRFRDNRANNLPTNSQQLRCTPAEIERKRREAKMRLEANKLKKKINSSGINIQSLGIQRPGVKR